MPRYEPAGDAFQRASSNANMGPSPEDLGEPFPQYLAQPNPDLPQIELPDRALFIPPQNDFQQLVINRRSHRRYDTEAILTLAELGFLLQMTQGLREGSQTQKLTRRFVASAGSRHPFETYLAIARVEGLEPGIYHYLPEQHALELWKSGLEALQSAHAATYNQKQVLNSAVTFYWVAEVYRTSWRYGMRAYRYIYLDAGHVCQNLYLAAESIGYGVCAIAAFDDQLADAVFELDGKERFTTYMASVGKKPATV
jgi:SagB-type dehydrogenase family enzyme